MASLDLCDFLAKNYVHPFECIKRSNASTDFKKLNQIAGVRSKCAWRMGPQFYTPKSGNMTKCYVGFVVMKGKSVNLCRNGAGFHAHRTLRRNSGLLSDSSYNLGEGESTAPNIVAMVTRLRVWHVNLSDYEEDEEKQLFVITSTLWLRSRIKQRAICSSDWKRSYSKV